MIAKLDQRKMIGETFGRLTVIEEAPKDKWGHIQYFCICSCGNRKVMIPRKEALISGKKQSCGCLVTETNRSRKKPFNKYIIENNDAILYDSKGNTCVIDKEDIPKLSKYGCWYQDDKGYWRRKDLQMHRIIMGEKEGFVIDHKDGNPSNNRKNNLRHCSAEQNACNKQVFKNNRYGYTGIRETKYGKWVSYIRIQGINIHLGTYLTKEDAYEARCYAENILFKEFGRNSKETNSIEIKEKVEENLKKKGFL